MTKKERDRLRAYYSQWEDSDMRRELYAALDHIDRLEADIKEIEREAQRDAREAYAQGQFDGAQDGGWER